MIRNETEYQCALKQMQQDQDYLKQLKASLKAENLSPEDVARGLQATLSFQAQLKENVQTYEQMKQGGFDTKKIAQQDTSPISEARSKAHKVDQGFPFNPAQLKQLQQETEVDYDQHKV